MVKEKAKKDFLFLAQDILGYKYNPKKRKGIRGDDPIHKAMIELLKDNDSRFKLMMFFRGSYKTTFMIIYMIQRMINDPDITILYVTSKWELARKVLRECKSHLVHNQKLISLFGDFVPQVEGRLHHSVWNKDYIDIRQRVSLTKQPTISTAGVDGEVTGQHPDIVILDDVVAPKNVTTTDQKFKVIDYINECIPLLGTAGELIMVGTPWAADDAYAYVQENWLGKPDANGRPLFSFAKMGILDDDGNSTMPSVYDISWIERTRDITPTFEWATQYLVRPIDDTTTLFKRDNIMLYDSLPLRKDQDFDAYICIDPAISLDRKKCWTGIVLGIPIEPYYLYIDRAYRLKILPDELIKTILDLIVDPMYFNHIRRIGIEETSFQKIYSGSLVNELNKKLWEMPEMHRTSVVPLKPIDNKHKRIYALDYYVNHQQIYVKNGLTDMLTQLYAYPSGLTEHNLDLLDALAYFLQILPGTCLNNPYAIIKPEDAQRNRPTYNKDYDLLLGDMNDLEDRLIAY